MPDAPPTSHPAGASPWRVAALFVGAAACLTPWASPPTALALGVVLALTGAVSAGHRARTISRWLIQSAVVFMGLSMDLKAVLRAGASGMLFAAGTIVGTFAAGALLSRLLRTDRQVTTLISAGTAICGGSAIAAVSSVIRASAAQTGVALATVFVLNGAALYLFPPLGHWLKLTPGQFGAWAAVAIHDVSSVVGAAQVFDPASLETATAIKLSRALWIAPVALAAGFLERRASRAAGHTRVPIPWFILGFIAACAVSPTLTVLEHHTPEIRRVAKIAMTVALYLIGAGLSRAAIARVGWRPLALGGVLWVLISAASLAVVKATVE